MEDDLIGKEHRQRRIAQRRYSQQIWSSDQLQLCLGKGYGAKQRRQLEEWPESLFTKTLRIKCQPPVRSTGNPLVEVKSSQVVVAS
ncbi:hypothetical protein L1887_38072 [Cichorium endivia]|nr:hypothetical protein L1887_38072 [Cichorium endivia]